MPEIILAQVHDCITQRVCSYVEFQPARLGPEGKRRRPLHTLLTTLIGRYPRWRFGLVGDDNALYGMALFDDTALKIETEFVFVHQGTTDLPGSLRLSFEPKAGA